MSGNQAMQPNMDQLKNLIEQMKKLPENERNNLMANMMNTQKGINMSLRDKLKLKLQQNEVIIL